MGKNVQNGWPKKNDLVLIQISNMYKLQIININIRLLLFHSKVDSMIIIILCVCYRECVRVVCWNFSQQSFLFYLFSFILFFTFLFSLSVMRTRSFLVSESHFLKLSVLDRKLKSNEQERKVEKNKTKTKIK